MTTYAVNRKTKEHRIAKPGETWAHPWQLLSADEDGWIEWYGGECPLPDGHPCQVCHRDGEEFFEEKAGRMAACDWTHSDNDGDIIAYRPILDAKPGPARCDNCDDVGITAFGDDCHQCDSGKPPAWDGKGLPPVGCECREIGIRRRVRIIAHACMPSYGGETGVAVYQDMGEAKEIGWGFEHAFEPIHSESQRAEDAIAAEALSSMDNGIGTVFKDSKIAKTVYAAIRDGKIPGVRLDR